MASGDGRRAPCCIDSQKLAVIPLRTFRIGGVHVWVATTDSKPAQSRFAVQINSEISEILAQEIDPHAHAKGSGKGQQKGKPKKIAATTHQWPAAPPPPPAPQDDSRLVKLEEKFEKLEARQQVFETKVDSCFGDIQDSLRQILDHTLQRSRDATGETPPPKQQKSS